MINLSSCTCPESLSYRSVDGNQWTTRCGSPSAIPTIPVPKASPYPAVLMAGGKRVELLAKIDTGASSCLFEHGFGEALGLRVEEGVRQTFGTANSSFDAYGHKSRFRFSALRQGQQSTFLLIRASCGMCSGDVVGSTTFDSDWWTTS
jgi:hypothetical protein